MQQNTCVYCGKVRFNFSRDDDYGMWIENNDNGKYVIAVGELFVESSPICFCPFCGRKLKEDEFDRGLKRDRECVEAHRS